MINFSRLIKMFSVFAIRSAAHIAYGEKSVSIEIPALEWRFVFTAFFSSLHNACENILAKKKSEVITICWTLSIITPRQIYLPCTGCPRYSNNEDLKDFKYQKHFPWNFFSDKFQFRKRIKRKCLQIERSDKQPSHALLSFLF